MLTRIRAMFSAAVCAACGYVFPAEPGDSCPRCGQIW